MKWRRDNKIDNASDQIREWSAKRRLLTLDEIDMSEVVKAAVWIDKYGTHLHEPVKTIEVTDFYIRISGMPNRPDNAIGFVPLDEDGEPMYYPKDVRGGGRDMKYVVIELPRYAKVEW